ncbi:MAG TPA: LysR family transcriptional regulator [Longimicrobiales bacterium]
MMGPWTRAAAAGRITDAQLRALVAVADDGSYTHAARRLGLTQSAVSHAITALERLLGVALIERSARGIRLTAAGARALAHAREILRLKAALVQDVAAAGRGARRRLRIASFGPTASRRLLPPLLDRFAARHPHVDVAIAEGTDDEAARWLHEGAVDAAFVTLPNGDFDTVLVAKDELCTVLPAGHPLARLPRVAPTQLGDDPFILTTGGCERLVREAAGPTPLDVRYEIREIDTLVEMVGRGFGIAVTPRLALPDVPPSGVAFVPLDTPLERLVGLAVRRHEGAGSAARALLELARS